ncbi:MAG: TIR domain-containing protein [Chloroflexi bacterium]|nr:TIR domain-containing protein [Chloroflexota bacterium]
MSNKRILIIDGEFIAAKSLELKLKRIGYIVIGIVPSGELAIQTAKETKPDLVLMNTHLRGKMDGIETAVQVRAQLDIPVIYITTHDDDETLQRAKITEAFGYLVTPFEIHELRNAIELGLYRHGIEHKKKSITDESMVEHALKIFLCHSSGDKETVRKLYRHLLDDGFAPWLDEESLLPGQDWAYEIPNAVRNSDVVLVCLSRGSINKSGYVQKEIRYALDVADEQPEGTIYLIPVKLEECELPERLRKWQWVNLFDEKGYDRLVLSLQARASLRK